MTAAVRVALTDTAIKRHQGQTARELRDPRHPLVLRYHASRERGSWFLIVNSGNKTHWRKIGNWPALPARLVIDRLPDLLVTLAADPGDDATLAAWDTLTPLLEWYAARVRRTSTLSAQRKRGLDTVINKHLIPLIGSCKLSALSRSRIDSDLILPLQESQRISYVRLIFSALKAATATARRLRMVAADPLDGVKFGDFVQADIPTKPGRLRDSDIPAMLESLAGACQQHQTLIRLLLMHGTRLGETRQAKWEHIDFNARVWHIPAEHTKTRQEHNLPLTDYAIALLRHHADNQQLQGYKGRFLFPGPGGALIPQRASDVIRAISNGEWSAHDLRKLARTCWADLGVDYMVGELLLNHALSRLDKTYIHTFAGAQCRAALDAYHGWLAGRGVL